MSSISPADALAAAGRAIHGPEWQAPLGRQLGVSRETIRRWLNGQLPLDTDHGVFRDLREVMTAAARASRSQADAIEAAERDLAAWQEAASGP